MNDSASLQNLHDIVPPPPVPWWPPAPGWYFVIALLLAGSIWAVVRWIKHYRANRYRREALDELDGLQSAATDPLTRAQALSGLPELLKRAALSAFSRDQVASLSGEVWHRFLDESAGIGDFCGGAGALLDDLAYDPAAAAGFDEKASARLFAAAGRWLKKHRSS